MKSAIVIFVLASLGSSRGDEGETLLPAPPVDVTAMARAEYQQAEQDFSSGHLEEAERHLRSSLALQHNHISTYDLALVHIRQGRLRDASQDLYDYFGYAPPALQDTSNAGARKLLHRVAALRGHEGKSGRRVAALAIASLSAGHYNVMPELDRALDQTEDLALFYWIVLGEYRMTMAHVGPKKFYKRASSFVLNIYRHMLLAYFNGADDLSDVAAARQLFDEIDGEYRRALVLDATDKTARARR